MVAGAQVMVSRVSSVSKEAEVQTSSIQILYGLKIRFHEAE